MRKYHFIAVLSAFLAIINLETKAQIIDLKVAAYTFSVTTKVGAPTASRTGHAIEKVYGDLKSTLYLFQQNDNKLCLLTSAFFIQQGIMHDVCIEKLSEVLNIPEEAIIVNSSHNHTVPFLDVESKVRPGTEEGTGALIAWELGKEFIEGMETAARYVEKNLKPVTVEWGVAEENRITYNRKGVRPDGTTYFMREEDRLSIAGEGYHGVIDPDAMVVLFKDYKGKPVTALTFFTGHPVAAYNPEKMISFGQFTQIGPEMLSDYLGGIPVGFVQGCGGNVNSKHMLTGTVEQAEQLGAYFGESLILATKSLRTSKRTGFEWSREIVNVPYAKLPSKSELKKSLESIDDFIRRGNAGDEDTYTCVGMNFPLNLSPAYRAKLIQMVRPWYAWALEQHETNNLNALPEYLPLEIVVARFGDVGFVGLPFETFVQTGLKIKNESNLPCVLTCGYTDGNYGYIPNAEGANDREYMSGFFRYSGSKKDENKQGKFSDRDWWSCFRLPYKAPAGDACAEAAIKTINKFAR